MAIRYDLHLTERLGQRNIPEAWPGEIVDAPEQRYRDTATGVYIAIDRRYHRGREREFAVSYVIDPEGDFKVITIHPIQPNQKRNRIERGRWVPA